MSKPSISEVVTEYIEVHSAIFLKGIQKEPWISILEGNKRKTYPVKSDELKSSLIRYFRKNKLKIPQHARGEVIEELCAIADDADSQDVNVRVSRSKDSIQIDLNDESFNVVHISHEKKGFRIGAPENVFLFRPKKQVSLPVPIECKLSEFTREFQKLMPKLVLGHWLLILAFILKTLDRDKGSYAILVIGGPQGSGKTILSRRIKMLVDPADPAFYSPPEENDDIIVSSFHSHLLVYENMSGLNHKMADVFCRLSTGGGISKRKHYTNHDEAFYKLQRPVIINGIDEPSNRPDFLDRCITLELQPIPQGRRISETELESNFTQSLPKLLGGLYFLLSECLRIIPTIKESNLPRMTDYALMGIAAEKALGIKSGTFLEVYNQNRNEQSENAFWNDDLCCAIYGLLEDTSGNSMEGTAHELMRKIFKREKYGKGISTARGFSGWLKRVEPILKLKEIVVERPPRSAKKRKIIIRSLKPIASPYDPIEKDSDNDENEIYDI